jgi:ATP-dependent Lon protease
VSYLEWLASLPCNKLGGGAIDIPRARQVLDEDHFDLEQVKDRILEHLAVKKLRRERLLDEIDKIGADWRGDPSNSLDTIPGPLRDRMEILALSGYTDEEKIGIAQQYLIPKQLAAHALSSAELSFSPDAIRQTVRGYTREAGVRNLEREIASVARKVARRLAEGQRDPVRINPDNLVEYLGRPRFFDEVAERTTRPGVATGLAWTPAGGRRPLR